MRKILGASVLALTLLPAIASAQTSGAAAPAASTTFTTSSSVADILANPAAKAVLVKDAPALVTDQLSQAGSMQLEQLKQYAPTILTDAVLAQLNADFAKIPAN